MGLLSFFNRKAEAASRAAGSGEPAEGLQQARTRARQRLIGAVVLVVIGVIGFPLVFETQPRPIPVDIPIEIPRKEGAAPLVMPSVRASAPVVATAPAASVAAPRDDVITETRAEAGRDVAAAPVPVPVPVPASAPVAERTAPAKATPKAPAEPAAKKPTPTDSARAKALLEGEAAAPSETGRFVVQVGAFAEVAAARETRQKVEKLGLKTYTQVAQTASGSRIRVRVGPFASREEADKALAKARAAGITAVVLTL